MYWKLTVTISKKYLEMNQNYVTFQKLFSTRLCSFISSFQEWYSPVRTYLQLQSSKYFATKKEANSYALMVIFRITKLRWELVRDIALNWKKCLCGLFVYYAVTILTDSSLLINKQKLQTQWLIYWSKKGSKFNWNLMCGVVRNNMFVLVCSDLCMRIFVISSTVRVHAVVHAILR